MSGIGSYTRVYLLTGTRAHLLPPGQRASDTTVYALCGITAWPTHFRGTADYGERQQAGAMPLCSHCARIHRSTPGRAQDE